MFNEFPPFFDILMMVFSCGAYRWGLDWKSNLLDTLTHNDTNTSAWYCLPTVALVLADWLPSVHSSTLGFTLKTYFQQFHHCCIVVTLILLCVYEAVAVAWQQPSLLASQFSL
jgi:hypothetical protein